ncbi:MAG: DUF6151 family protein [Xanthomonadales bacterium]|nr:DUF6151 family protein [Xanthomonadales bacterium]
MTHDLPIRCRCGALQGMAMGLSPRLVNRAVCYCDDCQIFAHFLGRAEQVLDEHGGTEVYQMSPKHLELTSGVEHLACVRLKPKGLYRWYADCCNTPLANAIGGGFAFVGVIRPSLRNATDEAVGPIGSRVFGRYARGDVTRLGAHDGAPLYLLFPILGKLLIRRLRGDHRHSPLFDPATGKARVPPKVLTPEELSEVERTRRRGQV